jgi:uncharacterized low-complexity protein
MKQQRVEEKAAADRQARSKCGEVMRAVPENKQVGIAIEGLPLGSRRRSSQEGREGLEKLF